MADMPFTVEIQAGLGRMFRQQRIFQQLLDPANRAPVDRSPGELMSYVRTQALALTDEVHEAMAETGWKPWATSEHINRDAYAGEIADVFIFAINMALAVDMAPSELVKLVTAKQDKNVRRQKDGYDGVSTKCPQCKRAYDDTTTKCAPVTDMQDGSDKPRAAVCQEYGWPSQWPVGPAREQVLHDYRTMASKIQLLVPDVSGGGVPYGTPCPPVDGLMSPTTGCPGHPHRGHLMAGPCPLDMRPVHPKGVASVA